MEPLRHKLAALLLGMGAVAVLAVWWLLLFTALPPDMTALEHVENATSLLRDLFFGPGPSAFFWLLAIYPFLLTGLAIVVWRGVPSARALMWVTAMVVVLAAESVFFQRWSLLFVVPAAGLMLVQCWRAFRSPSSGSSSP